MSGYIVYLLFVVLGVMFWRARTGRSVDQLLDDGHHHHLQVLATNEGHPTGGDWADHTRWMAEQE
jgi:hypothetical protein